jgi:polyisoprenoid-binding protein YceI
VEKPGIPTIKQKTMRTLIIICLLLFSTINNAQKIYSRTGTITFEASVPSFEEVKATNKSVTCLLNTKNGEIASLALVKGFRFKIALMEEHFNENYAESDSYPKATFKGKIENFNYVKLSPQPKEHTIKGKIEFHGKTKNITIKALISKDSNTVNLTSDFSLNSDDFNIEIPNIVSNKVSKKVDVNINFNLK